MTQIGRLEEIAKGQPLLEHVFTLESLSKAEEKVIINHRDNGTLTIESFEKPQKEILI